MKYQFNIKVPVYDFNCRVIIADNVETYINKTCKQLELDGLEEDEVQGYAMCGTDIKQYYIFYDTNSLTTINIVHEVCHIVDFAFEARGIELTGEPRAYLTGHMVEQVLKYCYKKNLLKDKWINNGQVKTEHIHQHGA